MKRRARTKEWYARWDKADGDLVYQSRGLWSREKVRTLKRRWAKAQDALDKMDALLKELEAKP